MRIPTASFYPSSRRRRRRRPPASRPFPLIYLSMATRLFFAAAVVAFHSLTAIVAEPNPQITPAPVVKRSSHHDLAKRQSYPTNTPLPLTQYHYPFSAIPEQVNPFPVGRGPQSGYNKCNSTTEGASSECQTLVVNTLVYRFSSPFNVQQSH